jgi:hypothetical protein
MGGLVVPFGDVLGGQRLAQPGVLVVHLSLLLSASAPFACKPLRSGQPLTGPLGGRPAG